LQIKRLKSQTVGSSWKENTFLFMVVFQIRYSVFQWTRIMLSQIRIFKQNPELHFTFGIYCSDCIHFVA
jgi:hypothetical protein